ncbi:hypothetical protein BT63DRAFT_455921 [Microthyrium microscopicum]|uniref:C2H2-type domain-containing protein n=1 Tax=Microthyrium microscopicum TaxID=703497 RepID=A0A6A6U7P2_9PEZI|nr:hypothetical protein BT63DRAFT_455921 [Microthyrium microscopicum]
MATTLPYIRLNGEGRWGDRIIAVRVKSTTENPRFQDCKGKDVFFLVDDKPWIGIEAPDILGRTIHYAYQDFKMHPEDFEWASGFQPKMHMLRRGGPITLADQTNHMKFLRDQFQVILGRRFYIADPSPKPIHTASSHGTETDGPRSGQVELPIPRIKPPIMTTPVPTSQPVMPNVVAQAANYLQTSLSGPSSAPDHANNQHCEAIALFKRLMRGEHLSYPQIEKALKWMLLVHRGYDITVTSEDILFVVFQIQFNIFTPDTYLSPALQERIIKAMHRRQAQRFPSQQAPLQRAPLQQILVHQPPVQQAPVQDAFVQRPPFQQARAKQASVQQTPGQFLPAEQLHGHQVPKQQYPAQQLPAQDLQSFLAGHRPIAPQPLSSITPIPVLQNPIVIASTSSPEEQENEEVDDSSIILISEKSASDKTVNRTNSGIHVCSYCGKRFSRPCDFTKHEKQHTRPFKCPEIDCQYHEVGWPTLQELNRHINDKHSPTPKLVSCQFEGCSFSSTRESNMKYHMEQKHNWTYVRARGHGSLKKRKQDEVDFDNDGEH